MFGFRSTAALGLSALLILPAAAIVRTEEEEIQFAPGDRITIFVVNRTPRNITVERVAGSDPIVLPPEEVWQSSQKGDTVGNFAVLFWDEQNEPIAARPRKIEDTVLRIDLYPGNENPGDTSLYLLDDGRVQVY